MLISIKAEPTAPSTVVGFATAALRVHHGRGRIVHIPIQIEVIRIPGKRILAYEPTWTWVVVSGAIVI